MAALDAACHEKANFCQYNFHFFLCCRSTDHLYSCVNVSALEVGGCLPLAVLLHIHEDGIVQKYLCDFKAYTTFLTQILRTSVSISFFYQYNHADDRGDFLTT